MNKKLLALDLGDSWVGVAVTDESKVFVFPKEAVKAKEIFIFLEKLLKNNEFDGIVLGLPITMKNKESAQTKKVIIFKEELEQKFSNIMIYFQDERLSSKFAGNIIRNNKISKNSEHSIAASIILENFLMKKL